MATTYKQPRETFSVQVFTAAFRMHGNVHLVPGKTIADLLNGGRRDVLPLTEVEIFRVVLDAQPKTQDLMGRTPFFGINRNQILWVAGGKPLDKFGVALKDVKTVLMFPLFMVAGDMRIPTASRVTDHLSSAQPFQTFQKVQVFPLTEGRQLSQLKPQARFDVVTVNSQLAIGALEG